MSTTHLIIVHSIGQDDHEGADSATTLSKLRVQCPECSSVFSHRAALINHIKIHGLRDRFLTKGKKTRKARTAQFKVRCMDYTNIALTVAICFDCGIFLKPPGTVCPSCSRQCSTKLLTQKDAAIELGIQKQQLSKWLNNEHALRIVATERPEMKKMHPGRSVKFSEPNEVLYSKFIQERKNEGEAVDGEWLKSELDEILTSAEGPEHGHKLSNGWLANFVGRYRLSSQKRTEKKEKSGPQRLLLIDHFYKEYQLLQRLLPQVCPIWGAFRPEDHWNADHIPWPFNLYFNQSYNPIGEHCWIKGLLRSTYKSLALDLYIDTPIIRRLW